MKVCQVNCVYGVGSTGKLTRDIHKSLISQGYDSYVIVPQNTNIVEDCVYTVSNIFLTYLSAALRRGLSMQYDWAIIQTWRIIRLIKRLRPDVVHLQCINGNNINVYMLLRFLARNNIKTIYTLHAEFPYTGGCGHAYDCERWKFGCGKCPILREGTQSLFIDGTHRTWKKQMKSYGLFNPENLQFTAVSPWLLNRAEASPMLKPFKKTVVMNGVDTDVFHYEKPTGGWRAKLGIKEDELMLLHVTASFFPHSVNLKGGRFIIDIAQKLKSKKIKIVVAANYGDGQDLPDNIHYLGRTKNQKELADLYREADLSVITSSRETFSMPVAESQCCGTPIVGFKAGGPESIALKEYSEFVNFGDVDGLCDVIARWSQVNVDKNELSHLAAKVFSKDVMTVSYINLYR